MGERDSVDDLLAFEVEVDRMSCIVFARTEKSARMSAVLAYWDAGYGRSGRWPPGVHAGRRASLDRWPHRHEQPGKCWGKEYVHG